jgi:Phasin protein
MAESPSKTPGTFDPEALLAAQQRNVEAFTNAGKIVAEGMRTYAQSQVGMMQGAMRDLWGAIQTGSRAPAAADPSDQLARMRAAFNRVLAQVHEVNQLLLKVQSEAMAVLNGAAAANAQALGRVAPNLAEMQKTVTEAMQNASRQVTAAIDEMRQRMIDLQKETRQAMGTAAGGLADPQTEQKMANQSVAGEEDPGVDEEVPETSGRRQKS